MPYSKWGEVNNAIKGIKPKVSLAQANLIAKWVDAMEEAEDGPENPWAAAIAQFKKLYRAEGGKWTKKQTQEAEMPMTDIGQIAKGAIETALAIVRGTGEIAPDRAEKLLYRLESDLAEIWQPGARLRMIDATIVDVDGKAVTLNELADAYRKLNEAKTKTVDGKPRPVEDFLVVEDSDKPSTWHLPVKVNGKPDHRLMGAAWAALHGGYRGNKYEGPDKAKAISKLKALYKSEDMEVPAGESAVDTDKDRLRDLLQEALSLLDEPATEETAEADLTENASGTAITWADFTEDVRALGIVEEDAAIGTDRRAPVLVDFKIINPGPGNKKDNHYYPADVLQRDISVFEGVDVFVTDHKDGERGEKTKVGRVRQCPARFDESAPVGQVIIYDPDQAEKTRNRADAGELHTLKCSILGRGNVKPGTVEGKKYKVVERLTQGIFLDLVSKAGAGGHALNLAESESGGEEMTEEQVVAEETSEVEEVQTEEATLAEGEQERQPLAGEEVKRLLSESHLPKPSQERLAEAEYGDEEAVQAAIKAEKEYVKKVSGSGEVFGQGSTTAPQERMSEADVQSAMDELDQRHGLYVKEVE